MKYILIGGVYFEQVTPGYEQFDMTMVLTCDILTLETTTLTIRGWMYIIIGSHFVPLEGKFLLIALVIVRITLSHLMLSLQ